MSHTLDRCEHEGIKWFPRVTVEKYSPDQSAWAERKLREELSWGRRLLVSRFGIERIPGLPVLVPRLHGDWLRDAFPSGPEDGLAVAEGNLLVANGLQNLVGYLWVGTATPPAGYNVQLTNAHTGTGVGQSATGALVGDTKLGGDTGSASTTSFYQQMDSSFPSWAGSGTANGGQMNGQVTVGTSDGNFNWQEWCWFTFTATASPFKAVTISPAPAAFTNPVMQNHWQGTSLGTKGSGATWVFSTTITLS
jgi:hypothetical protein